VFDPFRFEAIDWDDEDDENGNLRHCLRHDVDESVVYQVLREHPVEVKLAVQSAEFAIVGPDTGNKFWTLLFDTSWKRGDWLRPVTGWRSKPAEIVEWEAATGTRTGGRR
jgi:hypothetical protein